MNRIIFGKYISLTLAIVSLVFAPTNSFALADYLLGPGDKLSIRLNDLRSGTGEAYQWSAFNGEFSIDSSGKVSLPIIGETAAAGLTVDQLSSYIAEHVQSKVGLAKTPTASVQVIKFRPFYIIGSVERPGEYEFRPGLTVLQAVGVAGGFSRNADMVTISLRRESLSSRGELLSLELDRGNLLIKRTRLEAEFTGVENLEFPTSLNKNLTALQKEEQRLFIERRKADKDFVALNKKFAVKIAEELAALDAKDATVARQIEVSKKELLSINDLVTRGLTIAPRQTALEQTVAAYESTRVDVQLAKVRSQQEISRNEKDLLEYMSKKKVDLANDLISTKDRLSSLDQKILNLKALIRNAEQSGSSFANGADERRVSYLITRRFDNVLRKMIVDEGTVVEPGDVINTSIAQSGINLTEVPD